MNMNIFNLDLVVPIFSFCKFTSIFSVRVLTYIFEFFSNFVQLHDLVHFSIYLAGSICFNFGMLRFNYIN